MTPARIPVRALPTRALARAKTATGMAPRALIHVSLSARRRRTARPDQMRSAVASAKSTAGPGVTIRGVLPTRMCARNPKKLSAALTTPISPTQAIDRGFTSAPLYRLLTTGIAPVIVGRTTTLRRMPVWVASSSGMGPTGVLSGSPGARIVERPSAWTVGLGGSSSRARPERSSTTRTSWAEPTGKFQSGSAISEWGSSRLASNTGTQWGLSSLRGLYVPVPILRVIRPAGESAGTEEMGCQEGRAEVRGARRGEASRPDAACACDAAPG